MACIAFAAVASAALSPRLAHTSVAVAGISCAQPILRSSAYRHRAPEPLAINVAGVAVISTIIFIHECGHFAAARFQGIRVAEFAIGFGPSVLQIPKRQPDGVKLALRLLPLGGYVSFPRSREDGAPPSDEEAADGEEVDPADPDLLENRPFRQQALVVSAGVLANLALSWSESAEVKGRPRRRQALLFGSAAWVGVPVPQVDPPYITQVIPRSAAEAGGIRAGDVLLRVNGERLDDGKAEPLARALATIRQSVKEAQPVETEVERDGKRLSLELPTPVPPETSIGVGLTDTTSTSPRVRIKLPLASAAAAATTGLQNGVQSVAGTLGPAVGKALGGGGKSAELVGPIGIAETAGAILEYEPARLLDFMAFLSINLAVFNSLPVPGLDGFQLLVLGVERVRGKRLPVSTVQMINAAAAMLFLYLTLTVFVSDLRPSVTATSTASGDAGSPLLGTVLGIALGLAVTSALRGGNPDAAAEDGEEPPRPARAKIERAQPEADESPDLQTRLARFWAGRRKAGDGSS